MPEEIKNNFGETSEQESEWEREEFSDQEKEEESDRERNQESDQEEEEDLINFRENILEMDEDTLVKALRRSGITR